MKKVTATTEAVIRYLLMNKIFAWSNPTIGVYDEHLKTFRKPRNCIKGAPDILANDSHGLIGIEVKTTDRLSPDQALFMSRLLVSGARYCIVTNIEDLLLSLTFWGYIITPNGMMDGFRGFGEIQIRGTIKPTEIAHMPNANLVPHLQDGYRLLASNYTEEEMRFIRHALGPYSERIISTL
jgi:hypothetical protein